MSIAEIMQELPGLNRAERRAIARRVFELEDEREELEWATRTAELAFQTLDTLEEGNATPQAR